MPSSWYRFALGQMFDDVKRLTYLGNKGFVAL